MLEPPLFDGDRTRLVRRWHWQFADRLRKVLIERDISVWVVFLGEGIESDDLQLIEHRQAEYRSADRNSGSLARNSVPR